MIQNFSMARFLLLLGFLLNGVVGWSASAQSNALTQAHYFFQGAEIDATQDSPVWTAPSDVGPFSFFCKVGDAVGTSPTLGVVISVSPDNVNWFTMATFTQIDASDEFFLISPEKRGVPMFVVTSDTEVHPYQYDHLLPYVKATATIGGTDSPSFADVNCSILYGKAAVK